MRAKQTFRRTTLLLWFLSSLLLGLYFAKFTTPIAWLWCVAAMFLFVLAPRKDLLTLGALIIIGFVLGWWRGGLLQQQAAIYQDLYREKTTITARATQDGTYSSTSQLTFAVENAQANGQQLPGKIKVSGYGATNVNRHDIVQVTGKLYPARGGNQASMSYADIDVLAVATSKIETFRKNFIAGMETALPEPAASFGIGLLVGERSLLPADVALVLTAVGLTHIVAVSGYNLTIIVHAVTRATRRLSRFQTLVLSLILIYGFILVTGFSPSIVRAALVSLLSLLAWYFGRNLRPGLLILLVAALTAFINPFYIWGDIGWYLSFLAFTGVLILAPLVTKLLWHKDTIKAPLIGVVAVETFSAQLLTLPLIIFIFERLSVVGFIANIIIVPLVPLAMLLSFFAGLGGMLMPAFSGWVALPARYLLNAMLVVADWFSQLPHATIIVSISLAGFVLFYSAIIAAIFGLNKRAQSVTIEPTITK